MKRLLIIPLLIAVWFTTTGTFSMYRKDYETCVQRPISKCKWQNKYKLPTYDPNYMACAQPILDYCRCEYKPELVEDENINKDCGPLQMQYDY